MISAETVTRTVERLSGMSPAETQALANQMRREQPYVMVYLLAISVREEFTADESEILFFIGTTLWQLMRQNSNGSRKVTERALEKARKANEAHLDKMASDSEGDFFSAAEATALNSPEPEVLRYITEALMEDEGGNPENAPFSEEHLGVVFLHLKIVLDAFVASQK